MQGHEVPQRHGGRPAGGGVVGNVEHAADGEMAAGNLDDETAVGSGDPAPDAMQGDDIEGRQIGAVGQLLEGRISTRTLAPPLSGGEAQAFATWAGLKSQPQYSPWVAAAWMLRLRPWPMPSSR